MSFGATEPKERERSEWLFSGALGRSGPALASLLRSAEAAGEIRTAVGPGDLLRAVANLCHSTYGDGEAENRRMVALLIHGLRYGARAPAQVPTPTRDDEMPGD